MKKNLATAAALSLMLIACGDETSSTGPDQQAGGESSSSEIVLSSETLSSSSVKPSSSAEVAESSSGAESSSSEIPSSSDTPSSSAAESSSSVVVAANLHHIITDAEGQCGTKRVADDPMLDGVSTDRLVGGDEKIPPVAYRYVGTERTGFTIENISITCGLVVDTLDVNVSGDTVYVNASFDRTNAQRCMCDFKIDFAVDNAEAYSHAKVLVFDEAPGNSAMPNIMEIVDMDVVTIEEAVGHRQAKDIDLMCKNDRQTARALTAASNTLLPGKIDTTETAPVAARVVGNEGFDTIIISEVTVPCEIVFESFDVHASNGKLYVEPKVDPDSPITNCICPTRVTFKIEKNEAFSNTNYLVFDGGEPMPLKNGISVDGFVFKD